MIIITLEELKVIFSAETRELTKAIKETQTQIKKMEAEVKKSTGGIEKEFNSLGGKIGKAFKSAAVLGAVASAGYAIGRTIITSVQKAMDAVETTSLVETVFGDQLGDIQAWTGELNKALGLAELPLQKNAATLYNMTKSMGLTGEQALDLSKDMTLLTEDMASFYNLSSDEAFNKIRAGITGETEPLILAA